ncbi:XRE family transcriptional regulator [Paenibacillus dendritiformis]|nr:XRE family transcriptional regulator [Paenibacillus dendritiformis]
MKGCVYAVLRIREIRKDKKISGTRIAQLLDISPQYYYDIERGKKSLSAEKAAKLAEIFGVSVDYLLGVSDELGVNKDANQSHYALTEKDEADIAKRLEAMMDELESESALAFMGEPMDEEDRELLRLSLENALRMSKQMAKKKFTPKKYRE